MDTASQTALMVAAYRARATAMANPICHDPWAADLAGVEGESAATAFDTAFPHMTLWMAVRTAFIDRKTRQWLDAGGRQVVLLGAGMDTRAARLARPGVQFFEVDQHATQSLKRTRLAALKDYPETTTRWVTCDFERDDFLEQLHHAGWVSHQPALFIWEGVTYYLSEEAVRTTLTRLAQGSSPDSVVLFDHFNERMAQSTPDKATHRTQEALSGMGEPVRFGTNNPVPLLYATGFRHVLRISFEQACLALTGTWARERTFRFQWLVMASPRQPLF
ncbi:MAG: SAM-dependent methyltransferase [Myxococcota bacterium]